ncbi:MAG: hypothetical protein WC986_13720 [Elusimicrobiota bacterium]|jgi:hypothetical protein
MMTAQQGRLFVDECSALPLGPAARCARWGVDLLEEIPVPGLATAVDWGGCAPGTTDYPGRNHPGMGAWLWEKYRPAVGTTAADPMIGVGGLWLQTDAFVLGCDVCSDAVKLAEQNLEQYGFLDVAPAETWRPDPPSSPYRIPLAMFSPIYQQSHSSGASEHQQEIRREKRAAAVQQFEARFPDMRKVYANVGSWIAPGGVMIVILRNRIENGRERDEIADHVRMMRETGWVVAGAHPRDLERPTLFQQWKVARDPETPWIRWEWAIVAR